MVKFIFGIELTNYENLEIKIWIKIVAGWGEEVNLSEKALLQEPLVIYEYSLRAGGKEGEEGY